MGYPSLASEFPNDNAEISGGAIWICAELTGPATLDVVPYEPVTAEPFVLFFDDDDGYVDGPIELEISHGALSVTVHEQEPTPEQPAEDLAFAHLESVPEQPSEAPAFAHFESALVAALMTQGATRSAALVPRLLRLGSNSWSTA